MNIDDILIACGDSCDYCKDWCCSWEVPWYIACEFRFVVQQIAYELILDGKY